jgi:L-fuconolactonase
VKIDSHHHLWDPDGGEYPWMVEQYSPLRRVYGTDDLAPLLRASGIAGSVVVQARADLDESVELLAAADANPYLLGVVGWIDLTAEAPGLDIERLRASTGGAYLVGLRHDLTSEPDPAWVLNESIRPAFEYLAASELAFDLEVSTRELQAATTLAASHPTVRFVVDHMAKPPIAAGWSAEWKARLTRIATQPNVWCKLSGLMTEADWQNWSDTDFQPYVDLALEAFGVDRVMFGSDWPVSALAAEYGEVVSAMESVLTDLSDPELDRVFGQNAIDFYRLRIESSTNQGEQT